MRGATKATEVDELALGISIHAPHARSDHAQLSSILNYAMISIHAPHARSDDQVKVP